MKTVLVTLSNYLYSDSRERLCLSANNFGITNIISYDFEDIKSTTFYLENKHLLDNVKYMGYWLWKPFIIEKTLSTLNEGDVLIYLDAGTEVINSLDPLIKICETSEPILLFGNATDINSDWTKRDSFVLMDCDEEVYWFGPHCDASISLYRKCDESVSFVQQWLNYSSNENIISNISNVCNLDNIVGFHDHRYDQSVLSLVAQKHKINLYRVPSQFGNHYKMYYFRIPNEFNCVNQSNQRQVSFYSAIPYYNSCYGQLLNHHRTKNKNSIDQVSVNSTALNNHPSLLRRVLKRMRAVLQ